MEEELGIIRKLVTDTKKRREEKYRSILKRIIESMENTKDGSTSIYDDSFEIPSELIDILKEEGVTIYRDELDVRGSPTTIQGYEIRW